MSCHRSGPGHGTLRKGRYAKQQDDTKQESADLTQQWRGISPDWAFGRIRHFILPSRAPLSAGESPLLTGSFASHGTVGLTLWFALGGIDFKKTSRPAPTSSFRKLVFLPVHLALTLEAAGPLSAFCLRRVVYLERSGAHLPQNSDLASAGNSNGYKSHHLSFFPVSTRHDLTLAFLELGFTHQATEGDDATSSSLAFLAFCCCC